MTIKQQGGIFGRNPTFNDVETNDLTVTGTFAVSGGGTFEGDTLYIDAPNDRVGINTSSPQTALQVNTGAAGFGTFLHSSGAGGLRVTGAAGASGANILLANDFNGGGDDRWAFSLNGGNDALSIASGGIASALGGSGTERITVDTSGNMSLKTGNLVVASGSGIDFSATSGTGTSELFDDYEEGSFTVTVEGATTAGSGTYGNQFGYYTKVGRVVHFQIWIQVTSHTGTGTTKIMGLPFTSGGTSTASGSANLVYAANLTLSSGYVATGEVQYNGDYVVMLQYPTSGTATSIGVPVDGNMQVKLAGSYMTA